MYEGNHYQSNLDPVENNFKKKDKRTEIKALCMLPKISLVLLLIT